MAQMDEKLLLARLCDLQNRAEHGHAPCFSRFLDPGEMQVFLHGGRPACPYLLWGGYEESERRMVGFFPDYLEPSPDFFPLTALRIKGNELPEHRAVLGSVLGLGIERNLIGDVVMEEDAALVFVCDSICDYVCQQLEKVGRMGVSVTKAEPESLAILPKSFREISGTVASLRLDCILGLLTGSSRSEVEALLKREWVNVNFSVCTKGSRLLESGDVLSVRKFGRAQLSEILGETKKGRMRVLLKKYI